MGINKSLTLREGNITKTYISYLVPTIIGMLTNSIYCIVDVMFVGIYVGSEGLAAFNIAMPIYTFYSSLGLSLGVGGATTISVLIGQRDQKNVDKVFSFTVYLSMIIGAIISILGTVFLKQFALVLGATPALLNDVMDYLRPLQYVAMFYIINCTLQVIIRADYNPKLVMAAAVVGNVTNIFLDWLFVGVLGYGMSGAATATAIGPCIAVAILSFHYILKKNTMHFKLKIFAKETRNEMKHLIARVFKNGVGTFILEFTSGMVVFMFNIVLLKVSGQAAVAVYAIVSNIAYVGKGIFNGISQASQPLISVNYGAENYDRIKKSLRVALFAGLIFSVLTYALILIFPTQIIGIFINGDQNLMDIGIRASQIYFASFIFTAINTVLMYYFQSVENIKITTLIALSRGVIFIVIGLLVFPALFGEVGVWLTITFAEVITLLIIFPIKRKFDTLMHQKMNLDHEIESAKH